MANCVRACVREPLGKEGKGARTDKVVPIKHGDRILGAGLQTVEVLQVGNRVDAAAADRIVIPGDRTDEDDARVGRARHLGEEQRDH